MDINQSFANHIDFGNRRYQTTPKIDAQFTTNFVRFGLQWTLNTEQTQWNTKRIYILYIHSGIDVQSNETDARKTTNDIRATYAFCQPSGACCSLVRGPLINDNSDGFFFCVFYSFFVCVFCTFGCFLYFWLCVVAFGRSVVYVDSDNGSERPRYTQAAIAAHATLDSRQCVCTFWSNWLYSIQNSTHKQGMGGEGSIQTYIWWLVVVDRAFDSLPFESTTRQRFSF